MPETLFKSSEKYSHEMGYRSVQEFLLELLRRRVIIDEDERLRKIEESMDNDSNIKTFHSPEELLEHFDNL